MQQAPPQPPAPGAGIAPRVAAVVVNYNGARAHAAGRRILRLMRYPAFDLVVLDNASTGRLVRGARRSASPTCCSFASGRTAAARPGTRRGCAGRSRRATTTCCCSTTTSRSTPGCFRSWYASPRATRASARWARSATSTASRGGSGRPGAGSRFRNSITRERGFGEIDRGQYDRDEEVGYVTGCAILVRRAAAEAAGLWDPVYFICVDDADFCTRLSARRLPLPLRAPRACSGTAWRGRPAATRRGGTSASVAAGRSTPALRPPLAVAGIRRLVHRRRGVGLAARAAARQPGGGDREAARPVGRAARGAAAQPAARGRAAGGDHGAAMA